MSVLTSFLAAAASVARDNKERAASRRTVIKPFIDIAISQNIKEITADINCILSSVKFPELSESFSSRASTTASALLSTCFDATEAATSATAEFLDRLHRACSEDTQHWR